MVVQHIKDIDIKKLKQAKAVLAVLELLGLTENDLLLLKDVPAMQARIIELEEFKEQVMRAQRMENSGKTATKKTGEEQ